MSLRLCYFNVSDPRGRIEKGAVFVLYGEGSQKEYARLTANAIVWGAGVVAVAHGLDIDVEAGQAVIVYASGDRRKEGKFVPGRTLDEACPDETPDGPMEYNIHIDGLDILRTTKNCDVGDQLVPDRHAKRPAGWRCPTCGGPDPPKEEPRAGWFCVPCGRYMGPADDLPPAPDADSEAQTEQGQS